MMIAPAGWRRLMVGGLLISAGALSGCGGSDNAFSTQATGQALNNPSSPGDSAALYGSNAYYHPGDYNSELPPGRSGPIYRPPSSSSLDGGSSSGSTSGSSSSGSTSGSSNTGSSSGNQGSPGGGGSSNQGSSGGTSSSKDVPPTIAGSAPTMATVGQAYSFQPKATGTGKEVLSFVIANKPSWASFNATTGQLSGTPSASNVGTYSGVEISVTDGTSVASLAAFNITVGAAQGGTGSVTLSWQPPTENTNGSVLTNLAGYNVHYGTQSQSYTSDVQVANSGASTYVVQNLSPGTYYFAVTAYNSDGSESQYSPEVSTTIN